MHDPETVSLELKRFLAGLDAVVAAWEGGSAATGFKDGCSDLDLAVVCREDTVEQVISGVDSFLEDSFGIERRFRIPEPAWHGFSQVFYRLRDTPGFYYVDAAFIRESLPDKFTASDRHGDAVVWFQKKRVLDVSKTPEEQVLARSRKLYRMVLDQDFLMTTEIEKALARKRFSEAFPFYFQFLARNLAVLLNLKHRPRKADFGLRYAYRDYPAEDAALVEDLMKVSSLKQLESKYGKALKRYRELVGELVHFSTGGEDPHA
jgi:predicted nucleotidyltransferase